MNLLNQPIVLDQGSGSIKAGFAGGEKPQLLIPNMGGIPKHEKVMAGAIEGDIFMGKQMEEVRGLLKLEYPMERGIVQNWGLQERIWNYIYGDLKVSSEEHPILLTESALNPTSHRDKLAQIFFETFNVPALYISLQAVLSLYASGKTTGLVLDCGDTVTHAVPIYQGYALKHSLMRMDVGGRDITHHLIRLLRKSGSVLDTSAEREVVRDIKEKACYVAASVYAEHDKVDSLDKKESFQLSYRLPDGNMIDMLHDRYKAPEILFNPSLVGYEYPGVSQLALQSIMKSDLDIRPHLFSNIYLAGGSTLFSGFGNRMLADLKASAPADLKIRIVGSPDRAVSAWIGGSILASLSNFSNMWVSAEQWDEEGASRFFTA